MVHPFAILGFVLVKKAMVASVYYSIKQYGLAKTYRRLLEYNKQITPLSQQRNVQRAIKEGFYAPKKIGALLEQSEIHSFASKLAHELKHPSSSSRSKGNRGGKGDGGGGGGGAAGLSQFESVASGYLTSFLVSTQAAVKFFTQLQGLVDEESKKGTRGKDIGKKP